MSYDNVGFQAQEHRQRSGHESLQHTGQFLGSKFKQKSTATRNLPTIVLAYVIGFKCPEPSIRLKKKLGIAQNSFKRLTFSSDLVISKSNI